jgi:hypothetical protein
MSPTTHAGVPEIAQAMQHIGSQPRQSGEYDTDIHDSEVWEEKVLKQGFDPKLDIFFSDCVDGARIFKKDSVWCVSFYQFA